MSGVYAYINISNNNKTITIHTKYIYERLSLVSVPVTSIPLFLMGISFLIYAHLFRNITMA